MAKKRTTKTRGQRRARTSTSGRMSTLILPGRVVRGRLPIDVSAEDRETFAEGLEEISAAERAAAAESDAIRLSRQLSDDDSQ